MSKKETEEEDEFYDSETEPSFCEDEEVASQLAKLSINKKRGPTATTTTVYAVQLSNKSKINGNLIINSANGVGLSSSSTVSNNRIFINRENAMKLCKEDPENRRFKPFINFQEAYKFSYECSEIESGQAPSFEQVQASLSLTATSNGPSSPLPPQAAGSITPVKLTNTPTNTTSSTQDAERLPFPAPKKPEVNELRSFIEKDKFEQFRDRVVANPRFLISAGDAPVAVQVSLEQL
jgi:hypothetical protein